MSLLKKTLLITALICLSGCWETKKGTKIGTIVKCADEGLIVKTYECEIIRGGINNSSGSFGRSFHFTIEKEDLKTIANNSLQNQLEVLLEYHDEAITFIRREGHSEGFADSITIAKE